MQRLANQIAEELKTVKNYRVYECDLKRVWPRSDKDREAKIARFAEEHGWRLRYYDEGLCAIFDKKPLNEKV